MAGTIRGIGKLLKSYKDAGGDISKDIPPRLQRLYMNGNAWIRSTLERHTAYLTVLPILQGKVKPKKEEAPIRSWNDLVRRSKQ